MEPNGLTNHGFLEIEGAIDIKGDVVNTSGAWLNGWFDVEDGNLINETEARIDATDNNIDVEGSIYNYGTIVTKPAADLAAESVFQNFGVLEIQGGAPSSEQAFTNERKGVIKGFGMVQSDQLINNAGLIQSFGGGLVLHSRVDFEGPYFPNRGLTNTGTLTNSPGTSLTAMIWVANMTNQRTIEVNANGAVVFDSHLVNEPNAVIKLLGGTLAAKTITQLTDATFEGFGGITGDVIIDPNGIIRLTGPTNIVGDVNIPAGATLEISDGQTLIVGHTTNNGEIRVVNGKVVFQGGYSGSGIVKKE